MKKAIILTLVLLGFAGGAVGLYVSRSSPDWDGFEPRLLSRSVTINDVLKSPEKYLNRPIILRTNWITSVEGPWLADDPKRPLEDNYHISFRWATPDAYGIYSEKGVALNTYPVFIPEGPVLAVGFFRISDFKYYWGISPNMPHVELEKVYFDLEKARIKK